MQCSNCRFENMPGVEACGRCGTSLRLATAVLDVHPPRAQPWLKRARRHFLLPLQRGLFGLSRSCTSAAREVSETVNEGTPLPVPTWRVLARLVFPGWAHFYCGNSWRGGLFLGAFLTCLLPGLLLWGTQPGSILLGLAF